MKWQLYLPATPLLSLSRTPPTGSSFVAPYIKSATTRRLLASIPDTVTELTCVTRWLPEDIASGVCDLEIYDDILNVQGGRLLVHPSFACEILFERPTNARRFRQSPHRAASAGTHPPTLRFSSPYLQNFQAWQTGSL